MTTKIVNSLHQLLDASDSAAAANSHEVATILYIDTAKL